MTRISRSVAQRYAAAKKKRRKAPLRGPLPASLPRQASEAGETRAAEAVAPAAAAPASPARPAPRPTGAPARPGRRPSADYAEQYRYVWHDLRRILIIAGGLLAGLLALTQVIR